MDAFMRDRRRRSTTLECLPVEILESILLYSGNTALPQTSHLIGARLSSPATLVRFVIWAFHETWDQWFGIPTKALYGPFLPGTRHVPCEGDYELQVCCLLSVVPTYLHRYSSITSQTVVLEQPWAKIEILLQAQQSWADRYGRGRWYQHGIPWPELSIRTGHSYEGGNRHFDAKECFNADYQQALRWGVPRNQEGPPQCYQDVHPRTHIPTALLTGPWTEEERQRLFWLIRGGLVIESEFHPPQPWETKMDCLRNAVLDVSEPNALVVHCLMHSWLFDHLPRDIVRSHISDLDKRLDWGGDTFQGREIIRLTRSELSMVL